MTGVVIRFASFSHFLAKRYKGSDNAAIEQMIDFYAE